MIGVVCFIFFEMIVGLELEGVGFSLCDLWEEYMVVSSIIVEVFFNYI